MDEERKATRDEMLRRGILVGLFLAARESPDGAVSGDSLVHAMNVGKSRDMQVWDEREALELLRSVKSLGLATESVCVELRRGEFLQPKHLEYVISEKGTLLYLRKIPAVPGVWDERVTWRK